MNGPDFDRFVAEGTDGLPPTTHAGHAYTFVIARARDGVSAANLMLENGTRGHGQGSKRLGGCVVPGSHQVIGAQLTTVSRRLGLDLLVSKPER